MKKFFVEARTDNGMRITMTVPAETAMDAELEAGRKLISTGFKNSKISIVEEC